MTALTIIGFTILALVAVAVVLGLLGGTIAAAAVYLWEPIAIIIAIVLVVKVVKSRKK